MAPKTAPYGTWESPITAGSIIENSISVDDVIVDPITSTIYHTEKRPSEGGRIVLVKTEEGKDLVGKEWDCRTGVQEYGGAAAKAFDGMLYFSNFSDGRVYMLKEGGEPKPITPESKVYRYADFAVHPKNTHFIVAVLEDHTKPAPSEVVTTLCVINSKTRHISPLLSGADFYAAPSFSSDGSHFSWQQWSHPDMPWDGGEIHLGKVSIDQSESELTITESIHIAGKYREVSAGYPSWITNDTIMYTSDESGYQNPWTYTISTQKAAPILSTPIEEDFSIPAWTLGGSYGSVVDKDGKMALFAPLKDGRSHLYAVSLHSGTVEEIACPYVYVLSVRHVTDDNIVFIGAKTDEAPSIVLCTLKYYSMPHFKKLKSTSSADKPELPRELIAKPKPTTLQAPPNGAPLHVVYYPPTNPNYAGPVGEKPPCVVNVHGGPTGHEWQRLSIITQFFTSRGWAWLDVNYGGSSGYGRKYVDRLNGQWGVVDVRDCAVAVSTLSEPPYSLIDPARTAIRGGSSGGFTVLASLCTCPDAFAAGTSMYGISDLKKLDDFTHKFESRYMEKLMGGTFAQVPEVYRERSPVYNANKIKAPLLIEQGSLDVVVPPEQAEDIVKAIKAKGGRVDYVLFEGEGHGWRKAENIKTALEKEIGFYEDVFKLKRSA